jgi:hypothetical protein
MHPDTAGLTDFSILRREHRVANDQRLARSGSMGAVVYTEFDGQRRKRVAVKALGLGWSLTPPPSHPPSGHRVRRRRAAFTSSGRLGWFAVARHLFIALWRYLETVVVPDGVTLDTDGGLTARRPSVAQRAGANARDAVRRYR